MTSQCMELDGVTFQQQIHKFMEDVAEIKGMVEEVEQVVYDIRDF